MSASTKPTIFIVPGAWHIPYHYGPLTTRLEEAGYKAKALHLPSTGDYAETPNHDGDITYIRQNIQNALDQDEDVLVIVHSAGGVTGGSAVEGLSKADRQKRGQASGVVRMVYMSAFPAPEGVGVFKATNGPDPWIDLEGPVCRPSDPLERFYHDVPQAEAEEAVQKLQMHSTGSLGSDATYAAWKHIPSTYLICENDRAIPLVAQEAMIAQEGANFTMVERCSAGHSPFRSMPDFTAEVVRRAAGEDIASK